MATNLHLDKARPAEAAVVLAVYADVGHWLHQVKGIQDQWPSRWGAQLVESLLAAGVLYLARRDGAPVGCCILSARRDEYWGARSEPALYLHGLAVLRAEAGKGIGAAMIAWAAAQARLAGKEWLRLDCVASNRSLCQYYSECGFSGVDVTQGEQAYALFEKHTGPKG